MLLIKRKSIFSISLSPSLLLAITLLFPLKLFGADQPVTQTEQPASPAMQQPASPEQSTPHAHQPPTPSEPSSDGLDFVDAPRAYMTEKIISFASYMDRFFGGNRHFQESNQSVFQLDLTRVAGYGDNHKFELSGKMNLRLPGTEGRLRLWLETDPEKDMYDDPTRDTHTQQNKATTTRGAALAARYSTEEEKGWRFSSDAGVKLPISHLNPFVRLKGEYSTPMGDWRMKASESVYWFSALGVGETTQLDFEKVLSSSMLFRSSSNATWLKNSLNFDLVQSFSVYHTLNDRSVLIYQTSAAWITNPSFQATDYVALVFFRHRLHQKWLFVELSPQLHFPRDKDYKASPALSMRLEALFDESK